MDLTDTSEVKSARLHNGLVMKVEDGFKEESYESDLQK